MNGYCAYYRGKVIAVDAPSSLAAQTLAAGVFKAKKSWEVTVVLAFKGTESVMHIAID